MTEVLNNSLKEALPLYDNFDQFKKQYYPETIIDIIQTKRIKRLN